jgi:hypothetical protein
LAIPLLTQKHFNHPIFSQNSKANKQRAKQIKQKQLPKQILLIMMNFISTKTTTILSLMMLFFVSSVATAN